MGSSTGNLLVDDPKILEQIFSKVPFLIASHCEDEPTIRSLRKSSERNTEKICRFNIIPLIRSEEACYKSSSFAVNLAKKTWNQDFTSSISLQPAKRIVR
jgi:dihydroorotase